VMTVMLGLTLLLTSVPAVAAQSVPQQHLPPRFDTAEGPTTAPMIQESADTEGGVSTLATVFNPWGCESQSDYPHWSSHFPGTINAVGHTWGCSQPQPQLSAQVQLQRRRGVWPFYWWENVGQSGYKSCTNCYAVTANSATTCVPGTNVYRGYTYSWMLGLDGQSYSATTYSAQITLSC